MSDGTMLPVPATHRGTVVESSLLKHFHPAISQFLRTSYDVMVLLNSNVNFACLQNKKYNTWPDIILKSNSLTSSYFQGFLGIDQKGITPHNHNKPYMPSTRFSHRGSPYTFKDME